MEIKQKVNIHNRFDVHIDNIETGEHRELVGYNIILDQMWTRLCAGNSYFGYIHFGTGTGTPTPERTSLFSHLGTKSAVTEETIKALPVSSWKRKIVLNPEEYVGQTISEVGIAYGTSASNLVTHAMLKDAEGNPISIAKTSTDVVTIYATVFVTMQNTGTLKLQPATSNSLLSYLVAGTTAPVGSFGLLSLPFETVRLGSTPNVVWTADTANKKRKTSVERFGISTGNGNVIAFSFSSLFTQEFPATGIFEGQQYSGVHLGTGDGVATDFNIPSDFVKPETVVTKVDGVVTPHTKVGRPFNSAREVATISSYNYLQRTSFSRDGLIMAGQHANYPYGSYTTKAVIYNMGVGLPFHIVPGSPDNVKDVALSGDGTRLACVSTTAPYAFVFDYINGTWERNLDFDIVLEGPGASCAISDDGRTIIFGYESAPFVKTVKDNNDGTWSTIGSFGAEVAGVVKACALSDNATQLALVIAGALKMFMWESGNWVVKTSVAKPSAEGFTDCAITGDGTRIAVIRYERFIIYDWDGSAWIQYAAPTLTVAAYTIDIADDGSIVGIFGTSTSEGNIIICEDTGSSFTKVFGANMSNGRGGGMPPTADYAVCAAHYTNAAHDIFAIVRDYALRLSTAPETSAAVTADYAVKGIHKTDQYVIDVSFSIQFGEGV